MKEKHGEIRARAATAIWKISRESDATIDLIPDLDIEKGQLSYTIRAIGEIGGLAKDAIPTLKKHLSNQDRFVREAAKKALGQISGGNN